MSNIFKSLFLKNKRSLGIWGEDYACGHLKRQGYEIIERNFRLKFGEVDIIAKQGDEIAFIEVKTRTNNNDEFFAASVNRGKQKRIIKAATHFLSKQEYNNMTGRFDVIFISGNGKDKNIEHIKDAFQIG